VRDKTQKCSNCGTEVDYFPRYPSYLCFECMEKVTDKDGRPLEFDNTELMGAGCQGYYLDVSPTEKYNSDTCYIDGVEYYAQEMKFGGIVIQRKKSY
jgi:DNA-directed RNA polymerase subunit RPC12/RpoP